MVTEVHASDLVFLVGPLVLGLGLSALLAPSTYRHCGRSKSPLQPPGWVFGVAWTALYALFGVAAFLAWRSAGRRMTPALGAAVLLLVGLVIWPIVFFNFCFPALAFASILGLLGYAVAVAAVYTKEGHNMSALLSLPLVAWLSFASVLSYAAV